MQLYTSMNVYVQVIQGSCYPVLCMAALPTRMLGIVSAEVLV